MHVTPIQAGSTAARLGGGLRPVRFDTDDGLRLHGMLNDVGSDSTVIHVHGQAGNFYENDFVDVMREVYAAANLNFLAFNNRGHASYVEAYQNRAMTHVGSAVEDVEDCLLDIEAAVRFARTVGPRVVLQGHCLGGHKVLHYGRCVDPGAELVLLAPCDNHRVQSQYIHPERVEDQLARLRSTYRLEGMEWLPEREVGVKIAGAAYHIPMVAKTLVGLIESPVFRTLRADLPWHGPPIENPSFMYIGDRDAMMVDGADSMRDVVRSRFSDVSVVVVPGGGHQLKPVAHDVATAIADWLGERRRSRRRDEQPAAVALAA